MITFATVGLLQEPVHGDLRNGFSGFAGDFVEGVHYFVEVFVSDRRALLGSAVQSAYFWEWLAATDFSLPHPKGLQTTVATFWSRPSGINSHSKSRPTSE
jgi:hypothetical protein